MIKLKKLEKLKKGNTSEETKNIYSVQNVKVVSNDEFDVMPDTNNSFNYGKFKKLFSSSQFTTEVRNDLFDNFVKQYGKNVWVYAAVYQISVSIASVPLILYKKPKSKSSRKRIFDDDNHPLVKLFRRPNFFNSQFDLKEAIVCSLELTGNTFIEEVYDKRKVITELYVLQPHKVTILPDPKKKILSYIYNTEYGSITLSPDVVTHIYYHNPFNDFLGISASQPASINIDTNNLSKIWNKKFFENSALPKGVLIANSVLDDKVIKRIKSQWKAAHGGLSKAHEVALLEGGLQWQNLEVNRKDLDFSSLMDKDRDQILVAFGVPSALLGIVENVNNASLENLKKIFWENTLLPKMEKIESALNFNIIEPIDSDLILQFDKDSIEALKENQQTRARIASILVDRGILTINEARERLFNLPKVPWGDMWFRPLNLTPVDKIGEGMGVAGSGENENLPLREIGRPSKEDENIV